MAKKLMALLAAVALAGAAQAASVNVSASNIYYAGTTTAYTGQAYLYVGSDSVSLTSLAAAWFNDNSKSEDSSLMPVAVSDGGFNTSISDDGFGSGSSLLLAIFDSSTGNIFLSSASVTGIEIMGYTATYGDLGDASSRIATSWMSGDTITTHVWYTDAASAAPEPTSGLLLLVGGALLALRRKRA